MRKNKERVESRRGERYSYPRTGPENEGWKYYTGRNEKRPILKAAKKNITRAFTTFVW